MSSNITARDACRRIEDIATLRASTKLPDWINDLLETELGAMVDNIAENCYPRLIEQEPPVAVKPATPRPWNDDDADVFGENTVSMLQEFRARARNHKLTANNCKKRCDYVNGRMYDAAATAWESAASMVEYLLDGDYDCLKEFLYHREDKHE